MPDAVTAHYGDGGLCAALIEERTGIPFSFTAHSLGAQKMDKMSIPRSDIAEVDARHLFDVNMDEETLEETAISEFHDLGAKVVILTRFGGVVTVSDNGNLERVGPLPEVEVSHVTVARDACWSALLMAHLDGRDWPEAIHFAHEVASLKRRVEGHVERMIDRESLYASLKSAGQRTQ
jgi:sugar/nucleoside kinase (ribokinase family)